MGFFNFCQQLYKQYYTIEGIYFAEVAYEKSVFNFYTYLFAAAILMIIFIIYKLLGKRKQQEEIYNKSNENKRLLRKSLPHIVVMAVCLFAATYLQTMAATDFGMPPQVLYPLIRGGCLITVTIVSMLFFGERPNRKSLVGSGVALIGIILINIL